MTTSLRNTSGRPGGSACTNHPTTWGSEVGGLSWGPDQPAIALSSLSCKVKHHLKKKKDKLEKIQTCFSILYDTWHVLPMELPVIITKKIIFA